MAQILKNANKREKKIKSQHKKELQEAKAILKTWLQVTVAETVPQPKGCGNATRMLMVAMVLTAVQWQRDDQMPHSDND